MISEKILHCDPTLLIFNVKIIIFRCLNNVLKILVSILFKESLSWKYKLNTCKNHNYTIFNVKVITFKNTSDWCAMYVSIILIHKSAIFGSYRSKKVHENLSKTTQPHINICIFLSSSIHFCFEYKEKSQILWFKI